MTTWIEPDYDRLFPSHPPTRPASPRGMELTLIASDLGRSTGAIKAR